MRGLVEGQHFGIRPCLDKKLFPVSVQLVLKGATQILFSFLFQRTFKESILYDIYKSIKKRNEKKIPHPIDLRTGNNSLPKSGPTEGSLTKVIYFVNQCSVWC